MATTGESSSDTSFKESVQETVQALRAMEENFDDSQLVTIYFSVAEDLYKLDDFEQVLHFGNKALTGFVAKDDGSIHSRLLIVDALRLLAKSCYSLNMYDQSFGYLNRADTILTQLIQNNVNVFGPFIDIQMRMFIVRDAMGNRDEAVVHTLKALEIKEKTLKEGCYELGDANTIVFEAYLRAFDHRAALPFCLKALRIYEEVHGKESVEVAEAWRKLAVIHQGRKKYRVSLHFNMLAVSVLQNKKPNSPDLLSAEVQGAYSMIELGRYQEAVDTLKGVVTRDGIGGWLKVKSFLTMARALCCLGNVSDAERYIHVARRMLEENEIKDPVLASIGFSELSLVYQKKDESEAAIAMMKTALASSPMLPQKLLLTLYTSFMSLISKSGKLSEEVSYLEVQHEILRTRFGLKHCVVGYGYANLGVAYFGSRQKETGIESLENAKAILDDTLGSHHLDSLKISHCLSLALETHGRYNKAIEVEERVIEGLKGRAKPNEEKFLARATKHLNNLKERVAESPTRESSS